MTHNLNAAPFIASSIGAHLGGQIMALDFERGHLLLSEAWPDRSTDPAAGPVMAGGRWRSGVASVLPSRAVLL